MRTRTAIVPLAVAVLLIAATFQPALADIAHPVVTSDCAPTSHHAVTEPQSDIDGDGQSDLVVGEPNIRASGSEVGAIDVHGSRSGNHVLTSSQYPALHPSAAFGSSIAQIDINGDGCDDLLVGDYGSSGGGAVDIIYGSSSGLRTDNATRIASRTSADRYGEAVTVDRHLSSTGALVTDLWIGAPERTVHGLPNAGAVDHYTLASTGQVTFVETITAASAVTHDKPQAFAAFGLRLDAFSSPDNETFARRGAVLVGTPEEKVDQQPAAGSATWLLTSPKTGRVSVGQRLTRDTPGILGTPGYGDRFGRSVTAGAGLAIGAPGASVTGHPGAGLVQTFDFSEQGLLMPTGGVTQATPGVPGNPATGAGFGTAVAGAFGFGGEGTIWIGVPGQTVAGALSAGAVVQDTSVVDDQGQFSQVFTMLTQGSTGGLGGAAEDGDQLGLSIGYLADSADFDVDNALAVGVPGEDLGTVRDAGLAVERASNDTGTQHLSIDSSTGPATGGYFGSVFAQEVDASPVT